VTVPGIHVVRLASTLIWKQRRAGVGLLALSHILSSSRSFFLSLSPLPTHTHGLPSCHHCPEGLLAHGVLADNSFPKFRVSMIFSLLFGFLVGGWKVRDGTSSRVREVLVECHGRGMCGWMLVVGGGGE